MLSRCCGCTDLFMWLRVFIHFHPGEQQEHVKYSSSQQYIRIISKYPWGESEKVQEERNGTSTWHSLATTFSFFLLNLYTDTYLFVDSLKPPLGKTYVEALNRSLQCETSAPGHRHQERQQHDNDQRRKKMLSSHWIGINTVRIFWTFTPGGDGFFSLSCTALLLSCSSTLAELCWLALWMESLKGCRLILAGAVFNFHTLEVLFRSSCWRCTENCPRGHHELLYVCDLRRIYSQHS